MKPLDLTKPIGPTIEIFHPLGLHMLFYADKPERALSLFSFAQECILNLENEKEKEIKDWQI